MTPTEMILRDALKLAEPHVSAESLDSTIAARALDAIHAALATADAEGAGGAGPWRYATDLGNAGFVDRYFVESDDSTHDVRLYINGDFADDAQRKQYGEALARRLNTAPTALDDEFTDDMHGAWDGIDNSLQRTEMEQIYHAVRAAARPAPVGAVPDRHDEYAGIRLLAVAKLAGLPDSAFSGGYEEADACRFSILGMIARKLRVAAAPAAPIGEAVGVIVADDPVHGWHMQALKPWDQIGAGAKLYTHPAAEHAKPEPVERPRDNEDESDGAMYARVSATAAPELYAETAALLDPAAKPDGSGIVPLVEQAKQAEGFDTPRFREILKRACSSYGMLDVFDIEVSELLAYIGYRAGQQAGAVDGVSDQDLLKLACLHTGKRVSLTVAECFEHIDFGRAAIASANQKGE